jgi:hypothetical protein
MTTIITTAGLLTGAKPTKEATNFVAEYVLVFGSIFCAVPVLPAAV